MKPLRNARQIERAIFASGAADLVDGFDATAWLADARNVALAIGPNVALLEHRPGHTAAIHWLFTARGREALRIARSVLEHGFIYLGLRAVSGVTPVSCRAARLFNRMLGGTSLGMIETPRGEAEIFFMSREMFDRL